MTFTTHGHHIAGTVTDNRPTVIHKCGGPGICKECTRQADAYTDAFKKPKPRIVVRD